MKTLRLCAEKDDQEEEIDFEVSRMVNAGYTGRDQESVKRHIEELKKEGIPAPESTPTAYEVITKLIYTDDEIEGGGKHPERRNSPSYAPIGMSMLGWGVITRTESWSQ